MPPAAVRCISASSSSAPATTRPAGATRARSTSHMELPVMQEIARIAERGKFDLLFISDSMVDGPDRPSLVPVPLRADHADHGARRLHHACRARRHGLDQLLRAVQRRPHLRLDRPSSAAAAPRGTSSPAPTPRRRSTSTWTSTSSTSCAMSAPTNSSMSSAGCGIAGRTARSSPTRRPAGTSTPTKVRPLNHQGRFFKVTRPAQHGALPAGPSGHHPGRRLALGAGAGGAHRRCRVLGGAGAGARQGGLCRPQGAHGQIRPRTRTRSRCCPA